MTLTNNLTNFNIENILNRLNELKCLQHQPSLIVQSVIMTMYNNNVWNLFKVYNKDVIEVDIVRF